MKIQWLGILLAVASIDTASAGVYKCAIDGKVSYQSSPCAEQSGEEILRIVAPKKMSNENSSSVPMTAGAVTETAIQTNNAANRVPDSSLYISPLELNLEPPRLDKQFFAVKVNTRNHTNADIAVSLHYKGVDKKGYELVEFYIKGEVPAKQVRILTEKTYTLREYFDKVDKWVLAEKELKNKI